MPKVLWRMLLVEDIMDVVQSCNESASCVEVGDVEIDLLTDASSAGADEKDSEA